MLREEADKGCKLHFSLTHHFFGDDEDHMNQTGKPVASCHRLHQICKWVAHIV